MLKKDYAPETYTRKIEKGEQIPSDKINEEAGLPQKIIETLQVLPMNAASPVAELGV